MPAVAIADPHFRLLSGSRRRIAQLPVQVRGITNAARVWFILQYFGINCVILNGGWPVLSSASGLPAGAGPSKGIALGASGHLGSRFA
jgi:hypothetical protein